MATPLNPQEIYLLERYSSLEYFGELRDHFAAMLKVAEDALAEFMRYLPPDYRSRPLHEQPDAVWGERVIPNLRWTMEGLNEGYIRISHGDLEALGQAGNVVTAFTAITRDYTSGWMAGTFRNRYTERRFEASERASNISITALGNWGQGSLGYRYTEPNRGPLNAPSSWPSYRLNPRVQVKTDSKVPRDGVYLPETDASPPQLLIEGYQAWGANIPDDPGDPAGSFTRLRCAANHPCPRAFSGSGGDAGRCQNVTR